jgi:5-methylcytosine-specific restriction endonuclease McrA
MNLKNIKVEVVSKHGKKLDPTNGLVATSLVARDRAEWVVYLKKIKIIRSRQDWKTLKRLVIKDENRLCYICGDFIPEDEPATVDHVIPRSKYGKDERKNLRCCCKRCNDDKLDMTIYQYAKHVEKAKMKDATAYPYLDVEKLKEVVRQFRRDLNEVCATT